MLYTCTYTYIFNNVYVEVHMKTESFLLLPELVSRLSVDRADVIQWVDSGLLSSKGQSEEGTPFFSSLEVEKARHINRLAEMGYSLTEIRRIIRKVGVPGNTDHKADHPDSSPLTVGVLAERVGVSTRTIKHWEEKGIIEPDMRSEGGFRLYSESFVFLCHLVRDLQLFGYSLDEIKRVSDMFRTFLSLQESLEPFTRETADAHINDMFTEIARLTERMNMLKAGIRRWEGLLSKKGREISTLRKRNHKRNSVHTQGETE